MSSNVSGSASRPATPDGSGTRKPPAVGAKTATQDASTKRTAHARSSEYRGLTLEESEAGYHADARVMARMGYVPEGEAFSTVVQHVIKVNYVHAPERVPAVMAAVEQVEAESAAGLIRSWPVERTRLARIAGLYESMPLELKIPVGGLAGALLGIGAGFLVSLLSGESPDALILIVFGVIGLSLGAIKGVPEV